MTQTPLRYVSAEEDSSRWIGFPFREGDIVISTRSKSGTTWVQMICALLIFQTPHLPAPLATLSPWLDWLITARDEVYARLDEQNHRRFIKTHTPLDGIPVDKRATYIVVARDPLDMAVSLYEQGGNLDRERLRALTGRPEPTAPPKARLPVREWLLEWIGNDAPPQEEMDSLRGVMWHLSDAWARRHEPNVVLVHFEDLLQDLTGEMHKLAVRLEIEVPEAIWPTLVDAATFTQMRARAEELAPNSAGVLLDPKAFFRRGVAGSGRQLLTPGELTRYHQRVAALAPPDLLAWLHRQGTTFDWST